MGCTHLKAWKEAKGHEHAWQPLQQALLTAAKGQPSRVPPQVQASVAPGLGAAFLCVECGDVGSLQRLSRHNCGASSRCHELLVDLERQELRCSACDDYVYDAAFDEAMMAVQSSLLKKRPALPVAASSSEAPGAPSSKALTPMTPRSKAGFKRIKLPHSWMRGAVTGQPHEGAVPVTVPEDGLPMGLRGLSNLGNTCFMSSVLQAMLHAPLLRAYFLGAGHPRELCPQSEERGYCLSCELDRVFGEQYSGNRKPFSPIDLLQAWWMHADHLAGYQQHDAHEFYLNILCAMDGAAEGVRGMLRKHIKQEALALAPASGAEESPAKGEEGSLGDESVAESVFGGILRSDVTCQGCGYTSTAYDPFLDISLTLHNWNAPKAHAKPPPAAAVPTGPVSGVSGGADSGMESGSVAEPGPQAAVPPKRPRGRPRIYPRPATPASRPAEPDARAASPAARRAASPSPAPITPAAAAAAEASVEPSEDGSLRGSPTEPLPGDEVSNEGGTPDDTASDASYAGPPALSRRDSSDSVFGLTVSPLAGGPGPPPAPTAAAAPIKRKPGRPRRCGTCYHCINRHLKKACIANMQERQAQDPSYQPQRGGLPPSGNPDAHGRPPAGAKGATLVGGDFPGADGMAESLVGCLHAYMRPEKLGATDRWVCGSCQQQQQAIKQMSIRRLPPVLCLHIKRFEHHGHRKGSRKVDTPLIFPVQQNLDMSPFTSSLVLRKRFSDRGAAGGDESGASYELYAVITHRGKMDGGHYIAFLKVDGLWYQCDDSWIVPVEVETVKKCQAYMLYYKRKDSSTA